jgi:hypothetical protein
MRPALIAAMILAAFINFSARSKAQQSPTPGEKNTQTETSLDRQSPSSAQNTESPTEKTEFAKTEPTRWYTSPEWVLVIVGIITCGFIGWQSYATQIAAQAANTSAEATQASTGVIQQQFRTMLRQTFATETAAEATKVSAEAVLAQTDLLRDTAQRQLRAYVCQSAGMLKFYGTNLFEAQVTIKNFGQTPAYDVQQWMHISIGEHPLRVALPDPPQDLQVSVGIIPPTVEHWMVGQMNAGTSAPELVLGTPRRTVYVRGRIRYRDAFGERRQTDYRLIFGGPEGARRRLDAEGAPIGLLQPDVEGNGAN